MAPRSEDRAEDGRRCETKNDDHRRIVLFALGRVAARDRAGLEELYRRTSAKLFAVCHRILPVRAEAEEALKAAYLAIWHEAGMFDSARDNVMGWLAMIARREATGRAGQEKSDAVAPTLNSAYASLEAFQEEGRLALCLGMIDGEDAKLIREIFVRGNSYAALARNMGMSDRSLRDRVTLALKHLNGCMQC